MTRTPLRLSQHNSVTGCCFAAKLLAHARNHVYSPRFFVKRTPPRLPTREAQTWSFVTTKNFTCLHAFNRFCPTFFYGTYNPRQKEALTLTLHSTLHETHEELAILVTKIRLLELKPFVSLHQASLVPVPNQSLETLGRALIPSYGCQNVLLEDIT